MDSACIIGREHLWLAEWRMHRKWWFGSGVLKKALNTMWDKDKKCACLHFNGSTRSANIMKNPEINGTSSLLLLLFEGISLSQQKGIFNIFC